MLIGTTRNRPCDRHWIAWAPGTPYRKVPVLSTVRKSSSRLLTGSVRAWQCGTIQLDVLMPRRFELGYRSSDGERRFVVMLHRALYGSVERFLGLLLERHRGALPLWLAPEQVRVLPVGPQQHPYARQVQSTLTSVGLRVHVDARQERLARRVLDGHEAGARMMCIVGEQERRNDAVTLREGESQRVLALAAATEELRVRCMPPDLRIGLAVERSCSWVKSVGERVATQQGRGFRNHTRDRSTRMWHRCFAIHRHTTATLTQWIGGSESNRQSHFSPPSRPIQSWPVVVPK